MTAGTIAGIGTAIPEARLTNADLEARLDTSDEWILARKCRPDVATELVEVSA